MSLLHLLEPEESIGNLWHALVGAGSTVPHYPNAAVTFEHVAGPLRIFFRGVGGDAGAELKPALPEVSHHRLSRRIRLGKRSERVARARYSAERLSLPAAIDVFPFADLNERLYFWLAAWTAASGGEAPDSSSDPFEQDVLRIHHAGRTTARALQRFPGLARHYDALRRAALVHRPERDLPPSEAAIEQCIRNTLAMSAEETAAGAHAAPMALDAGTTSPPAYRTYLPGRCGARSRRASPAAPPVATRPRAERAGGPRAMAGCAAPGAGPRTSSTGKADSSSTASRRSCPGPSS